MIDSKNLNRVKGILSAHKGAEIPKFLNSGVIKARTINGEYVYSKANDRKLWYNDEACTLPTLHDTTGLTEVVDKSKDPVTSVQASDVEEKGTSSIQQTSMLSFTPQSTLTSLLSFNTPTQTSSMLSFSLALTLKELSLNSNNTSIVPTAVIGLPAVDVNTAVLNAAENNKKINNLISEEQINSEAKAAVKKLNSEAKNVAEVKAEDFNPLIKSVGMNLQELLKELYQNTQKTMQGMSMAGDVMSQGIQAIGGVFGALQAATDSETTKTISGVYNGVAEAAKNFGPIGEAVGTVMQTMGAAGDILQAMGGGTDLMTKTDLWMDSPLFSWNIGAINGFFGKEANNLGVDLELLSQVGSSYGGTSSDLMDAKEKAGKEYGLFSRKQMREANSEILIAKLKLNKMRDIANDATDQRLAALSMGELAGLAYQQMISGGYNLKYTYAAKQGGLLEWNPVIELEWEPTIEINWELPKFAEGGLVEINEELEWNIEETKPPFDKWILTVPNDGRRESKYYDLRRAYNELPFEVLEAWRTATKEELDNNEKHLPTVSETGIFYKSRHHPTVYKEVQLWLDNLKSKENEYFNTHDLDTTGEYFKYVKKNKEGGKLSEEFDIPEIEETNLKNVIPEGALHKNKHHMEHADGLTKKGIPVIDDDGDLQAEIEHSEIIFTLEVTKKLEEYYKIFYSEESTNKEKDLAAIDVGKLLVYLILENTDDRTGLIDICKEGGTLTLNKSYPYNKPIQKELNDKDYMKSVFKEALLELLTK